MKKHFSKRWLTNLLIVAFGLVILFITGLVTYRTFFMSASATSFFVGDGRDPQLGFTYNREVTSAPASGYRIASIPGSGLSFLEVFSADTINSVVGTADIANDRYPNQHPAYELPYSIVIGADVVEYGTGVMAIVPLPPYNYNYARSANSSTAAFQLLTWANAQSSLHNDPARATIASALQAYNQAILTSTSNFVVVGNDVLTKDQNVLTKCQGAPEDCDPDVHTGIIDGADDNGNPDAFRVSIDPNARYTRARANSLALDILNSTSSEAGRISDSANKTKIDATITNYRRQITTDTSSKGLTLTSVSSIKHGESQTVSFSISLADLDIAGSGEALSRFMFNIDQKTFCNVRFSGDNSYFDGDHTNCTFDSVASGGKFNGTFTWNDTTGQEMGTNNPGARALVLKAFSTASGGNEFGSVSKTVTVLPGTGDDTTPGSGVVPMSITVPQSIDLSKPDIASHTRIVISASDVLRTPNVGKIAWWVCKGTQAAITAGDSSGCEGNEKGKFGPGFTTNNITHNVEWNASSSEPGTYVIMAKAFLLPTAAAPTIYPDYPGAHKTVSSNITVVENMTGGDGDGDGGDGTGDGISGDVHPGWAANFQKSAIDTIDGLMSRIGGFSLMIMGILAIIAIIMAGMKYITAGGDPKGAEAGKKGVLFAIYGIIGAVLCVFLIKMTVTEVQGIIGNSLQAPANPGDILPAGLGGPNASVLDIIGNNDATGQVGILWRVIQLAVYYAEAVAIFLVLYASFIYITSFGDDSKAESGKKTLIWAVIGLAFILSANVLINIFGKALA